MISLKANLTEKGNKMSIAQQQLAAYKTGRMSWTELLNEADDVGEAYKQDFENERTWFEYSDRSVALFDAAEQMIYAYGSRD